MNKKMNSIRVQIIRTHLYSAIIIGLLFFVGLQMILLFFPLQAISMSMMLWLTVYVFLIASIAGLYAGYTGSHSIKDRMERISTHITVLSRGNYGQELTLEGNDEISRMATDLNELAGKIQGQVRSLQLLADEKAELAGKVHKAATMEERQRLARELHDAVSQQLFALSMMASATIRLIDRDPATAKGQLEQIAEMSQQAQIEMRALLLHLRPVQLSGQTLKQGIERLAEELQNKCTLDFQLAIEDIPELSKGTEDHLFRIVQEGIANILRHANATLVKVHVTRKQRALYLSIQDNGKGFDVTIGKKTSYGLKTMEERCEQIGGSFSMKSKQEEGTIIDVKVPLD